MRKICSKTIYYEIKQQLFMAMLYIAINSFNVETSRTLESYTILALKPVARGHRQVIVMFLMIQMLSKMNRKYLHFPILCNKECKKGYI